LDICVISISNNVHFRVCVASRLKNVLKAEEEEEHAAGVSLTHAALKQEGFSVSRRASNEEGSVLVGLPPDEWEELGRTTKNCGKNSGTRDLNKRIVEVHLDSDAGRVCINASTEGVGERRRPARDPRTEL
jgi:hypothetical protein